MCPVKEPATATFFMKKPMVRPSIAHTRQRQLVAACGPVWRFVVSLHIASIMRSSVSLLTIGQGLPKTSADLWHLLPSFFAHSLPAICIGFGRLDMLEATCATAHILLSCVLWVIAAGLVPVPAPTAASVILEYHAELIVCLVYTYQYQLRLPIMAVLHAIHQAGWMAIILWRMEGDLHRVAVRFACNWTLMMLFSSFLEMRVRAAHQRTTHALQQRQHKKGQQEKSELACIHPDFLESTADLEIDLICSKNSKSIDCQVEEGSSSRSRGGHGLDERAEEPATYTEAASSAGTGGGGLPGDGHATAACREVPGLAAVQQPTAPAPPATMQGRGVGLLAANTALVHAPLTPSQHSAVRALLQVREQGHTLPYMRRRAGRSDTVHVKLHGIEMEHLPPDLPKLLQEQLSYCMPGVTMTGLALRSGCVVMTLDLEQCTRDTDRAVSADGMAELITRLMQSLPTEHVLEDRATMSIQMPDELALHRWDTASSTYMSEDAPALELADVCSYRMVSAGPAVHCLPDNTAEKVQQAGCSPDAPACHHLTLTMELELPSSCQLHGWQPASVAAPAGSRKLLQDSSQDGPEADAMLLVRRLDGGYLPVVVERLARVDTDDADSAQRTTAQVLVMVDGIAPAALCLELWCQATAAPGTQGGRMEPGHELLVSHMPLLVLPSSWKEAAEELQQQIVETGEVQPRNALAPRARDVSRQAESEGQSGCLLQDLGMWLTRHHRSAGTALPDSVMLQLGDELLVYAVQHGLGAVAGVIVDVMPRSEKQGTGDNPSPWLRRVAGSGSCDSDEDGDRLNLLHAAMLSGNADVLGQVFRWGALYGGPGWSWSWESEASEGLTALHFTASQPEDICRGMLETITRMLPAAQVHAARNAWLHCQGGVGTTPAELSGMAAHGNGDGVNFMWASDPTTSAFGGKPSAEPCNKDGSAAEPGTKGTNRAGKVRRKRTGSGARKALDVTNDALAGKPAAQPHNTDGSAAGPSNSEGSSSRGSEEFNNMGLAAADAGDSALTAATATSSTQPRAKVQSWLGSVVEVWGTPETEEYISWAGNQTFQIMHWWVVPLLFLAALGMYRSASEGCVQYELMHLCLHGLAYIPIVASARTLSWLGNWQAWMLVTHTLDAVGYGVETCLSVHQATVWVAMSSSLVNACCVVLISAALDQAPKPQLLVACMFVVYLRSLAYQMVGHPHPLRHAVVTDAIALCISTLARARQLRAFQAWLAELLLRRQGARNTEAAAPISDKPDRDIPSDRQEVTTGRQA